jgi:predicted nucleotidyltransferase component of viral defense system
MLHLSTVDTETLELLRQLQQLPELAGTRLVGGTALALMRGHRKSVDLDLFGALHCDAETLRASIEKNIAPLVVFRESAHIHQYIINGIKVDIVDYKYSWIDDMVTEQGIRLAGLKDIAAMKVTAIVGRGTKKDFIDIAHLLNTFTMKEILQFYLEKYADGSEFMAMKSLAYFADADEEPMPEMLHRQTWEEVKRTILKHLH